MPAPIYSSAPYVLNRLNNLARYSARTRKLIRFARTAGNFIVGNPFTPAGQLSWALAAGKVGLFYGGHKAYKYIMSKRPRSSVSGGTQRYGTAEVDAGATNVVQRSWHSSRTGKRPKKNAKLALRMLNAAQSKCVMRYQRLSGYEGVYDASLDIDTTTGQRPLPLGHFNIGEATYMPVQLFDLTSISSSPEGGFTQDGSCNYSLEYSNGNFYWRPNVAKGPGSETQPAQYSSTRHWWLEESPSGITQDARPQITKRCYMPWVDIRMVLYGATTETTRFTVQLIQFKEDMYDPSYNNVSIPGGAAYIQARQRFAQFWNNTLKPKIYNPIASSGVKTESIYRVLSSKTYVVGPDSNTNSDVFQPNIVCKKFYNFNRVCKYDWIKGYDPSGGTTVTGNQEVAYPVGDIPNKIGNNTELDSDQYNQFLRNDVLPYLHPKAKVYLLVMADCYSQQTAASNIGIISNGATKVPCMDVVIRKKLIYDDT